MATKTIEESAVAPAAPTSVRFPAHKRADLRVMATRLGVTMEQALEHAFDGWQRAAEEAINKGPEAIRKFLATGAMFQPPPVPKAEQTGLELDPVTLYVHRIINRVGTIDPHEEKFADVIRSYHDATEEMKNPRKKARK